VELWLGRILAKCESLSGKSHMNINDSVYSPGSRDCDSNQAYITRAWLHATEMQYLMQLSRDLNSHFRAK